MVQKNTILKKMNDVLDQLIENAQQLNVLSQQVIEEEEILSLQSQQQEIFSALVELDNIFYQEGPPKMSEEAIIPALQNNVDEKIEIFQRLNSSFLENIMNNEGLIQFKSLKSKKTSKKQKD